MSTLAPAIGQTASHLRTAILAGVIGNVLEWYDFAVYGYFVPVISQLFFPNQTPLVSLLLTFSVFGVGFVMRPVGSLIFGQYGDRHGRKRALSAVILLMAVSTFAVGLLPNVLAYPLSRLEPYGMLILIGILIILPLAGSQFGLNLDVISAILRTSTGYLIRLILVLSGNI